MTTDTLQAALDYADRGWRLFPCVPGEKNPLTKHGLKDATADPDMIRKWWRRWLEANIGLRTGIAFDVLDIDGLDALRALDECMPLADDPDLDPIVNGPTVDTPRGLHVYVSPTGRKNTVKLGGLAGIDWRGLGGYVIAPPSRKSDATSWDWVTGTPFDLGADTPIVPAPAWVLALFDRALLLCPCRG